MLVLTRRIGESVVIGDDIHVTVLGVKGSQIRLGIDAPKEVSVHREEIYKQIQKEKHEKIMDEVASELEDDELIGELIRAFGQSANETHLPQAQQH